MAPASRVLLVAAAATAAALLLAAPADAFEYSPARSAQFFRRLRDHQVVDARRLHAEEPRTERRFSTRDPHGARARDGHPLHPKTTRFAFTAFGRDLVLQLERNDELIAPAYKEERFEGDRLVSVRHGKENCYYRGRVEGIPSSVAVSTCHGLHGSIRFRDDEYFIEPAWRHVGKQHRALTADDETFTHLVYRTSDILTDEFPATCGVDNSTEMTPRHHAHGPGDVFDKLENPDFAAQARDVAAGAQERRRAGDVRYMELVIGSDHLRVANEGAGTEDHTVMLINIVADRYATGGFEPAIVMFLAGQRVFQGSSPFATPTDASALLDAWCGYRTSSYSNNDDGHLISGLNFDGNTVGLAWVGTACDSGNSCGVNQQSYQDVTTANTITHEIGHNLDADHDQGEQPECPNSCRIMSACDCGGCNGEITEWSPCSKGYIDSFLTEGPKGYPAQWRTPPRCMDNTPTALEPECGNGFVEEGEVCDCGRSNCGSADPCCNGQTCQLKSGSQCSDNNDECCQGCQIRPASDNFVCREAATDCDVAETCNGASAACPADDFAPTGESCSDGSGLQGGCSDGVCTTLDSACATLIQGFALDSCGLPDGCSLLHCEYNGRCYRSSSLGQSAEVPDGVPCTTGSGGPGTCVSGSCESTVIECPFANGQRCNNQGSCSASGVCSCAGGWSGSACETPPPCPEDVDGVVCHGTGACDDGVCNCNTGYSGDACDVVLDCPTFAGLECNGKGSCLTPGACTCDSGFSGSSCQVLQCPNGCSQRGVCLDNDEEGPYCLCFGPWRGSDCGTPGPDLGYVDPPTPSPGGAGVPYRIVIVNQPGATLVNGDVLSPQPSVRVVDSLGDQVDVRVRIVAEVIDHPIDMDAQGATVTLPAGSGTFSSLAFRGVRGDSYVIKFWSDEIALLTATSDAVTVEPCPTGSEPDDIQGLSCFCEVGWGLQSSSDTSSPCVICPAGSYSATFGLESCESCPAEMTTSSSGATSNDDCFCAQSGYVRNGDQCVAEETYDYDTGAYGACSKECGGGTKTRDVVCVSSSGNVVSDSFCSGLTRPDATSDCNLAPCTLVPGEWSPCSKECGGGTKTRTLKCKTPSGSVVPMDDCEGADAPAESASCNAAACEWATGDFGACSVDCGGGTKTRPVVCTSPITGFTVSASECEAETRPDDSEECNTQACATYNWSVGDYSQCSQECNGGTKTRSVVCRESTTGNTVDDGLCGGGKPAGSSACNTDQCLWSSPEFGACSAACGPGEQTRIVECYSPATSNVVDDSFCNGQSRPDSTRSCNLGDCVTYSFVVGEWGACSETCGGGTRSRTVQCTSSEGQAVSNGFCSGSAPASTEACNTQSCVSYSWNTPDSFGTCSKECNTGTQTRTVECVSSLGTVVQDELCPQGLRPDADQPCNVAACEWRADPWSSCSADCGGGVQTREVSCFSPITGFAVAEDQCTGSESPDDERSCNTQACTQYNWRAGDFSACSQVCSGGTRTRTVKCMEEISNTEVSTDNCDPALQPEASQACNSEACVWFVDEWSQCSQPCGIGSQSRDVECKSPAGEIAPLQLCASSLGVPPESSRDCNTHLCVWYSGPLGSCSAPCGDNAVQTRVVECRSSKDDALVSEGLCEEEEKPSETVSCSRPCSDFLWREGEWSSCDAPCDGGEQSRTVECVDLAGATYDDAACLAAVGTQPAASRACNTEACKNFNWFEGAWDECTVECGGGSQSRTVECRDTSNAPVPEERCTKSKPETTRECGLYPCNFCELVACGDNGECVDGECECVDFFGGFLCDEAPSITVTSPQTYSRLAPGRSYPIEWSTTGSIPVVTIALYRTSNSWPQYIAVGVENTGSYTWDVPEDQEEADDYFIQVVASPVILGNTGIVRVSSGCTGIDCGEHGDCFDGFCTCTDGFSGTLCELSPCDVIDCGANGECNDETRACECTNGFTGVLCDRAPDCELECRNQGIVDEACTTCSCVGNWDGADCAQCGLECVSGTPSQLCTSCVCDAGYTGELCQLRFIRIRVRLLAILRSALDSFAEMEAFKALFSADISFLVGINVLRVNVYDVVFESDGASAAAQAGLEARRRQQPEPAFVTFSISEDPENVDERAIEELADTLNALFQDGDSSTETGITTAIVDPDFGVQIDEADAGDDDDSSGPSDGDDDDEVDGGDAGDVVKGVAGDLPLPIVIGGVVGGIALIVGALFAVKRYRGRERLPDNFDNMLYEGRGGDTGAGSSSRRNVALTDMSAGLPAGWQALTDDVGRTYYYNTATKESTHTRPS